MNYFEFKQQLLRDSFTKDEEFHRLRKEDLRCAEAYEKAMAFEKTLKSAFKIKAPDNLKDSIILKQTTEANRMQPFQRYAIAASVFLSFLMVSSLWYFNKPTNKGSNAVENYITAMVALESNSPLSENPIPLKEVNSVFAEFKAEMRKDIGKVHFVHDCHTPGGTGVHMILATLQGPVTVYYMPATIIDEGRVDFDIEDSKAVLVAMQKGSVAIIANTSEQLASIEPMLQDNLLFL
ncbi:MAG: DUF3379 family protein [Marinicellaceae bacterium]